MSSNSVPKGFKQTEVGVVPQEWEVVRVGKITAPRSERVDPRKTTNQEFCVELEHIESSTGRLLGSTTTNPDSSLKTIFQPGDILFGKLRSYLRKYWFAERGGVCSTEIWVLATKNKKIINEFLFQIIKTDLFIEASGVSFGTHMPRSDWGVVKNFQFTLPPLPEQRAIATALSDVDALLAKQEALIAKKRDIKQATMQQLLTGQTRLPGFSGAWEVKRLGDVAQIRSGGTPSTANNKFWNGNVSWCTPTDITALDGGKYICVTARKITEEGLVASSAELLPINSIVMTSRATIGECAINKVPLATNQGFKNFLPYDFTDAEFLYYLLGTQTDGFIRLCAGSTFLEIGKAQLLGYEVFMPVDKKEQTAIATILSDIDAEITALEQRRAKTRAIKQAMMQELLTGRVRLVDGAVG